MKAFYKTRLYKKDNSSIPIVVNMETFEQKAKFTVYVPELLKNTFKNKMIEIKILDKNPIVNGVDSSIEASLINGRLEIDG